MGIVAGNAPVSSMDASAPSTDIEGFFCASVRFRSRPTFRPGYPCHGPWIRYQKRFNFLPSLPDIPEQGKQNNFILCDVQHYFLPDFLPDWSDRFSLWCGMWNPFQDLKYRLDFIHCYFGCTEVTVAPRDSLPLFSRRHSSVPSIHRLKP